MYVQGVSTRKVAAILEELCGTSVSSTHVSQCAARLDADLEVWRTRPRAAFPYVLLDARYEKVRHGGRVLDCGSPVHRPPYSPPPPRPCSSPSASAPRANAPSSASASP